MQISYTNTKKDGVSENISLTPNILFLLIKKKEAPMRLFSSGIMETKNGSMGLTI